MNTPISIPIITAERFAEITGTPLGVIEAQLDRRILPVLRIGKRRFINLEVLRQMALSEGLSKSSIS